MGRDRSGDASESSGRRGTAKPPATWSSAGERPCQDRVSVKRFDWEILLRRSAVPPEMKYVGLMMATYASRNGADVRPGDERLARDCGKSLRTIVRNRRELARLGWLQSLPKRRRDDAVEYQLTVPSDLDQHAGTRPVEEDDLP